LPAKLLGLAVSGAVRTPRCLYHSPLDRFLKARLLRQEQVLIGTGQLSVRDLSDAALIRG